MGETTSKQLEIQTTSQRKPQLQNIQTTSRRLKELKEIQTTSHRLLQLRERDPMNLYHILHQRMLLVLPETPTIATVQIQKKLLNYSKLIMIIQHPEFEKNNIYSNNIISSFLNK